SEYRTVYVDVVYVKTDLPLKCVHLSSDNRDGHPYQNFTVQTYGSIPINCTIDFGDGDRKTNVTNRHQYYTAYFSKNYTRYGQYNISTQCYNELSVNTARIIRTVRRENMNKKMIIHKNLAETSEATRFYLTSRDDYACQHTSHLRLRNAITNETMKLIQRKKMLEVIPDE
ncbi:unnamed protein product, partial [Rotaria socialis]